MDPTPTPEATSQPAVNDGKNTWGRNASRAVLYCLQAILLWLSGYLIFALLMNLQSKIRDLVPLILLVFSFILALLLVIGFGRGLKSVSNTPESLRKGCKTFACRLFPDLSLQCFRPSASVKPQMA